MSYQKLLNFLYPDRPVVDVKYAYLSAPVRHLFMLGVVWYLAQSCREPFHILEIGSWMGTSMLTWGEGLSLFAPAKGCITCVDSWDPYLSEHYENPIYAEANQLLSLGFVYDIFCHNSKQLQAGVQCQHFRGKSSQILPSLRTESFDICFIDADHSYTAVIKDIQESVRLVKEGGLICGDDLNLQMHQLDPSFANAHAEEDVCRDPQTGKSFHPGVTKAVSEFFGQVSAWGGFWAMQKRQGQWLPLRLKDMPVHFPSHFGETQLQQAKSHLREITID